MFIINYLVNLGAQVMMPIIFTVFGLLVGLKLSKAVKSGLMIGIGFIGLNVIIALLTDNLEPVVEQMLRGAGLNFTVIDIGWPAASAIGFGSAVGILVIPVCLLVNVIMLLTKTTKTINVDIWNYWHFAFTGSIVYMLTKDLVVSLLMAAFNMIIVMVIADRTAPLVEKELGLPGISIPHAFTASFVPIAFVINWVLDRIPGVNKINMDYKKLQKKLGVFGDPAILGMLIGVIWGIVARYDVKGILNLGVVISAVFVLIPKMAAILMEGLMPVSETVQAKLQEKFKGNSKLLLGLDSAIGVGNPVTLTISLLLIPLTILMVFILPGNEFLPFASLSGLSFMLVLITPICRNDCFRTLVVGVVVVASALLIGTSIAPIFTEAAVNVNFIFPSKSRLVSSIDYGGSFLPFLIIKIAKFKWLGVAIGAMVSGLLMVWNHILIVKEAKGL